MRLDKELFDSITRISLSKPHAIPNSQEFELPDITELQNFNLTIDLAPATKKLAIIRDRQIILTRSIHSLDNHSPIPHVSDNHSPHLQCFVVPSEDEDSRPLAKDVDPETYTDVVWVNNDHFCVSDSTGLIKLYNDKGTLSWRQRFHAKSIIELTVCQMSNLAFSEKDSALSPGDELWALHQDGMLVVVPIQEIMAASKAKGNKQSQTFRKFFLSDQTQIFAVRSCQAIRPTLFQSHANLGLTAMIAVGVDSFISFYHAGNDKGSIVHLAQIASVFANQAAGRVLSFARKWALTEDSHSDADESIHSISSATATTATLLDMEERFLEDRRRCGRALVMCPTGRLAAISDSLGRVILVDTWHKMIIRMWKGYRNAQCGWSHGCEGSQSSPGLYLVIYSERRETIELWRARYGPLVATIAIGPRARLFTQIDRSTRMASCLVVYASTDLNSASVQIGKIRYDKPDKNVLARYFSQHQCQEEKFSLHQITGGLRLLAKESGDAAFISNHSTLISVLSGLDRLSSLRTVEAIVEVLRGQESSTLPAPVYLSVLDKLTEMCRKLQCSDLEKTDKKELLYLSILWMSRVTKAFLQLKENLKNASSELLGSLEEFVACQSDTMASSALYRHSIGADPSMNRMLPWLELYRRAGYLLSDDTSTAAWKDLIHTANNLSVLLFQQLFQLPLDRLENALLLPSLIKALESAQDDTTAVPQTDRITEQLFPIFSMRIASSPHSKAIAMFLYGSVFYNVFGVQKIQKIHHSIFLPATKQLEMFLEYFFTLPLGNLLMLAPPSESSPLQRWIKSYFIQQETYDKSYEPARIGAIPAENCRLCATNLCVQKMFEACSLRTQVFHAYVLSCHCQFAEREYGRQLEERTLGEFNGLSAGIRWEILQDSISKAVFISLCVSRPGRISVDAVENLDDILQDLALAQLNDSNRKETFAPVAEKCVDREADVWVISMESSRSASEMKSYNRALNWIPQLRDENALCCFRARLFAAAWNSDRSEMHQLEDAISELSLLDPSALQAALGVYIWEKYLRVHVVSLITYWEERARGGTHKRTLQPQIARRFFGIIMRLVQLLIRIVKERIAEPVSCESSDSGEEHGDAYEYENLYLLTSLIDTRRWSCPVMKLRERFNKDWPPPASHSRFLKNLKRYDWHSISSAQLSNHYTLLLVLDSFAVMNIDPVPISELFPDGAKHLCLTDSFSAPEATYEQSELDKVGRKRREWLLDSAQYDANGSILYRLAKVFGMALDPIRIHQVLHLYRTNQDSAAEEVYQHIREPTLLGTQLGSIIRARVALLFQKMKLDKRFVEIMSSLPADTLSYVMSFHVEPFPPDKRVLESNKIASFSETNALIVKAQSLLNSDDEKEAMANISVLVKKALTYCQSCEIQIKS